MPGITLPPPVILTVNCDVGKGRMPMWRCDGSRPEVDSDEILAQVARAFKMATELLRKRGVRDTMPLK